MSNDYVSRQSALDAEYRAEYERWFATLPPEEQARLKREGLDEADTNRSGGSREELDEARLSALAPDETQPDPSEASETQPLGRDSADLLASFCARIRSCPNPLMVFDAICFATGVLALDGVSQTDLAKRHNMTRAALSKTATAWVKSFGLNPSRGMKSPKARRVYAALTRERWYERNHRQSR